MATLRLRTRKDGSAYTSVLFRVDGKQSSMSFGDHAKAVRFKDLVKQVGPAKALEVIDAAERTVSALTVEEWIGHHISHLTGVEQETIRPPSTEICSVATIQSPKPSRQYSGQLTTSLPERAARRSMMHSVN